MESIWQVLFGWAVLGSIIILLIGIGFGVMSMTPPDFTIARICFSVAAAILTFKTAVWLVGLTAGKSERVVAAFLIFGVIGAAWIWSYSWVSSRKPKPPVSTEAGKDDEKPPTLLDLFRNDFPNVLKGSDSSDVDAYTIETSNGFTIRVKRQIYEDYEAKTKFIGFYIPRPTPPPKDFSGQSTFAACMELLKHNAVEETFDHFGSKQPL